MAYTQDERKLSVTTPLGKDVLLFKGLVGDEGISRLFEFEVLALAENKTKVSFEGLLGKKVTVKMKMGDDETPTYLNGLCNRVSQGGRDEEFTTYRLGLVPELWLLTRTARSRVFQQMTVPDILKKVLAKLDVAYELNGTYEPRDYCVQYRETDFNFASRLMEEEGIYYFFKHEDGNHKTVVADGPSSHCDVTGKTSLVYDELGGGVREDERVYAWEKHQEMRSGKVTLWDHTFEVPHKHLEAEEPILSSVQVGTVTHKLKVGGNEELELYDWPGEFAQRFDGVDPAGGERPDDVQKVFKDNARTTKLRMDEETVPSIAIRGQSNAKHLRSGHKFELERHFNANGSYVIAESGIDAQQTGDYRSGVAELRFTASFTCIPDGLTFRPPRTAPKPVIPGTQTAVVVGPKGEEILTDKYGRVKVQFHWDRDGKNDTKSSCWIRVAQLAAGRRWGTSFWPRIGQEVVVAFEEGDPDRPIIVGVVYNSDQMPPYLGDGPDGKHKNDNRVSGYKSNDTMGGVGCNEWRFDDTKGKEQVFIHAERNQDVRVHNDAMESVGHDKHLTVGGEKDGKKFGDYVKRVFKDKHEAVDGALQARWGDAAILVGGGDGGGGLDLYVEGGWKTTVDGHLEEHVKSGRYELVDGDSMSKVSGKLGIMSAGLLSIRGEDAIGLSSTTQVFIKAPSVCIASSPASFVLVDSGGVTIVGPVVNINSGGSCLTGLYANPPAPADAAKAGPKEPTPADDAKTGQKSS
jgi:type VI secretion system secreted protein VgrG